MISETEIKSNLRKMAIDEIQFNLTLGREDNNKKPFTNEEISQFVDQNSEKIDQCVNEIYNDYEADDELHRLVKPRQSQVREYLVDIISYPE